jgi:hypothetical protein
MKRLASAAITIVAVGGLIAGCGGSDGPSLRATGPITKAEATAYANNVNLGVADVPGWTSIGLEFELGSGVGAAEARCNGRPSIERRVVAIRAPYFVRTSSPTSVQNASSAVVIRPTVALVAQDFAAYRKSANRTCERHLIAHGLERDLAQAAATEGANPARIRFGTLVISPAPNARPDSIPPSSMVAARAVLPIRYGRRAWRMYYDNYTFHVGRAEVTFFTLSQGHAVATATEQHLLARLYERADAH